MQKVAAFGAMLLMAIAILATPGRSQQDKSKRPSPPATATCSFADGKTITTDYSSPRMKGRKVAGEGALEPWGKVWRLGANEATTFVTDANVVIGGKDVAAGKYTLFAVPNEKEWTLIVNKKTGEWGIPYKWESEELARVPMKVTTLPSPLEDFTISYEKSGNACTLRADWDTVRAYVDISEKK